MSVIQINYSDKKLEALLFYLAQDGTTLEQELEKSMLAIWEQFVPPDVRFFFESTDKPDPGDTQAKKRTSPRRKGAVEPSAGPAAVTPVTEESPPCAAVSGVCGNPPGGNG